MSVELRDCLHQVCYQRILPHVAKYREETDIEKCLPLMEPRIFAQFAFQACTDAAALLTKLGRQQYRDYTSNVSSRPAELRNLAIDDDDEEKLREKMLESIDGFGDVLDRFFSVLQRFHHLQGQAGQAAWHNGMAMGDWASGHFGGLPGLIVGVVGGYMAGSAIERQMQVETDHLHQEFLVMLQGYDQAMGILISNGVEILAYHRKVLLAAARHARC